MPANQRSAEYACALILCKNHVLLGRRAHFRAAYPECWDVIGGKIEMGETPQAALTRELGEEIGITPLQPAYVEQIADLNMDAGHPPIYHFFKVTEWQGGTPKISNHEHSHLNWFSLQQACDLSNLALPQYRELLARVLDDDGIKA